MSDHYISRFGKSSTIKAKFRFIIYSYKVIFQIIGQKFSYIILLKWYIT